MKRTIYIPVVLVVALSLSMVVALDYRRASDVVNTLLLENQILLAREVGSMVSASITKSSETAKVYAHMPVVQKLLSEVTEQTQWARQEVEFIIKASVRLREDIDNIVIFDAAGDVYLSDMEQRVNVFSRPYFQRALRGESTIDSVIGNIRGKRLLFCVAPVLAQGAMVGAVYVSFDVQSLRAIWDTFLVENKGYKVRIVSPDNTILLSSVAEENSIAEIKISMAPTQGDSASLSMTSVASAVVLEAEAETMVDFEDDGPRMGIWMPIAGTQWKILISLDKNRALLPLSQLLHNSIGANILAAMLVLGVTICFLHKLILRVRQVEARSREDLLQAKEELEDLVRRRTKDLHQRNQSLQQQRETLTTMLQTCPVGVSVASLDGKMLYINSQLVNIFQCTVQDDPQKFYVRAEDRHALSQILQQGQTVQNTEVSMLSAKGNPLSILVSASLMHYEGQDAELRWFFNVTAEHESNRALERERTLLRLVLDTIPDIVCYTSPEGKYLSVNTAFTDFVGMESQQILGRTDTEIMPFGVESCKTRGLEEEAFSGEGDVGPVRLEERAISAAGQEVLLETVKSICLDAQGRPMGILGISRDITERKRMESDIIQAREEAQAASRAKSDFIANMSHEIRTPMNGIMGLAYIVLQSPLLPPDLLDYVRKIDFSARSLLRIINDILDFSKIEAGKLEIEHIPFDLDEVLAMTIQPIIPTVEDKGLEILFEFAPSLPTALIGDPTRLRQVILNLVSNAVKFTEKGHIVVGVEAVRMSAVPLEQTSVLLQFTVTDTGIGIEVEYLSELFEAFTQADTSVTRRYGGTGLGLTICKRLVNLMGGQIGVKSSPGQGTRFVITLPFGCQCSSTRVLMPAAPGPGDAQLKNEADSGKKQGQRFLAGKSVLVVDDHALSRHVLHAYLFDDGARVEEACSGQEALELFTAREANEQPYAAVLVDWRMPGMDGVELARQLSALAHVPHVPVIMVTAYDAERVLPQAREVGVHSVLTKPVTPCSLRSALQSALQGHGDAQQASTHVTPMPAKGHGPSSPLLPADADAHMAEQQVTLQGKKVLLAEDNEINQLIAVELLSSFGMQVSLACNGQEAVQKALSQSFHIILMDIQMPEMDGLEAAELLRKDATLNTTPIIAMTAHAMAGDLEKSLHCGMQDHITKPIDPEKFYATLMRWVQQRGDFAVKGEE